MALELGPVIGTIGGGSTERIAVSMIGSGSGTIHPLTTVDAGDGALVHLGGEFLTGPTSPSSAPYAVVGPVEAQSTAVQFTPEFLIGGHFTGDVPVSIRTNSSSTSGEVWFRGVVYVTPYVPPVLPRYSASGGSSTPIELERATLVTFASHTVTSTGITQPTLEIVTSTNTEITILHNGDRLAKESLPNGTATVTGAETEVQPGDVIDFTAYSSSFSARVIESHQWDLA